MSNQNEKIKSHTPRQSEEYPLLAPDNIEINIAGQSIKAEPKRHLVTENKGDVWESLSIGEKVSFVAIAGMILGLIIYANVGEKTVEFYITTFFTITVVLIALSQYHVSKKQWLAMERQLHLIDEQADLMYHQLAAMRDALTRTDTLIEQNKSIIEAAKRQTKTARDALKLSEESFYVSERAYVCIDEIKWERIDDDGKIRIRLKLTNGGRTPAFDVRVRSYQCNTNVYDSGDLSDQIITRGAAGLEEANNDSVERIILAGKTQTIFHSPDQTLSSEQYKEWSARGARYIYIPIVLSYEDIHRDTHKLTYWYQLFPEGFSLRKPIHFEVSKWGKPSSN